MAFYPYLNFGGNCRQAFTRYREIFGGELVLLPMSEAPHEEPLPPEQADMIMHAALRFPDGSLLMASDSPGGEFQGMRDMWVSTSTADLGSAKRIFDALADGGEVRMPLGETFWSPGFGMCVDRFGTPWMVAVEEHDH